MRSKKEWLLEKKEAERWGYEIEKKKINHHDNDQELQPSNNLNLLYFAIDASLPHQIQRVYRGDLRNPTAIFKEGFASRGSNPSLFAHVFPGEGSSLGLDSGLISTSIDPKAALRFPQAYSKREMIHHSFIYEMTPSETGIDVRKEIPKLATTSDHRDFYKTYCKREKEIAFLYKINSHDIKGAWPVEAYDMGLALPERVSLRSLLSTGYFRLMHDAPRAYIPNPNYKAPVIPNLNDATYNPKGAYLWNTAKYAGYGLTGIGVALDAHSLYKEYQDSAQVGNFTNTYSEANRIVGGWAGASRLGMLSAQKALLYSASLTPLGQTLAVVISGVAGSVIGYYGGGEAVQWLYNINRSDDLIKPIYSDYIFTDKLSGTITTMKNGARVGKFTYNSTPAHDNNNTTKKSESEVRPKQYFSELMTTIQPVTNTEPHDVYLSALNQQTQSINQLFAAPHVPVDSLQHHLNALQSNASSRDMDQILSKYSSSTRDLSEHLQNLTSSQNTFAQAFNSTRVTDFSQFTQPSRPTYHFDTAQEAARYATFYSNYLHGNFSERPKPASNPFSFFGGDNRGEGGRGWDRACDSRYQDCSSSSNPADCRSANSDRCTSSLFK